MIASIILNDAMMNTLMDDFIKAADDHVFHFSDDVQAMKRKEKSLTPYARGFKWFDLKKTMP